VTSRWSRRGVSRGAAVGALCVAAIVGLGYVGARKWAISARRHAEQRAGGVPSGSLQVPSGVPPKAKLPTVLRPPNAAEQAVIAPLAVGSTLDGWRVNTIQATDSGHLSILVSEIDQSKGGLELQIFLASPVGPPAPATAGRYAIYYRGGRYDPAVAKVLAALAEVVGKNDVPPPPSMTPYVSD